MSPVQSSIRISKPSFPWMCYNFDLWSLVATKCGLTPCRDWDGTVLQMIALPRSKSRQHSTFLTLLAWKSTIYWTWNERNSRLHKTTSDRSTLYLWCLIDSLGTKSRVSEKQIHPSLLLWFNSGSNPHSQPLLLSLLHLCTPHFRRRQCFDRVSQTGPFSCFMGH